MSTKTDTPKDYQPVLRTIPYYLQGDDRVGYRHHRRRPVPRDTGGDAAMTPTVDVYYGDAWELAPTLEPQSIDCIVTSPPYWGLRDYGHPGQFGLESTPQEYVAKLVELFARLRPALKDQGTLWLNLGDSFASGKGTCHNPGGGENSLGQTRKEVGAHPLNRGNVSDLRAVGLKPKDLVGIPWRVAFALQADGWWLRSDIIWAKKNCMPESVTDRPTKSHEYLFLLAKSERYYYDQEAVREPLPSGQPGRNLRTVWSIATAPYSGAHFATMPPELAERCIKAGCPSAGKRCDCDVPILTPLASGDVDDPSRLTGRAGMNRPRRDGEGTRPITRREQRDHAHQLRESPHRVEIEAMCGPAFAHYIRTDESGARPIPPDILDELEMRGWLLPVPPCECPEGPAGTVLDPFLGSGTTAEVARKLGRNCVGFELNEDYRPLIEKRLQQGVLL